VLRDAGLWHDRSGSLHLAYREDEAQVLREFARGEGEVEGKGGEDESRPSPFPLSISPCKLLTPEGVLACSPAVRPEGLLAGLWSPTETCVDPREVIARLPDWLRERYSVEFVFGTAVTGYDGSRVLAGGQAWPAGRLFVCSGDDLQTLYPELLAGAGLVRCKLQMMRTRPYTDGWRIGPMLAAGLTLRHYASFQGCPTLPELKRRVAAEMPEYDRYGIHVLVSQNGRGEVILGDSHEYGDAIEPFDKAEIDDLVLRYLDTFFRGPEMTIAARWHGTYGKHPTEPYFVAHPAPNVTVVTGVGGAGMTLSFGLAEEVVLQSGGTGPQGTRALGPQPRVETRGCGPRAWGAPRRGGWGERALRGKSMVELVVFDMAGTTVYDGDAVNRCLRDALGAAGLTVTPEQVNAVMGLPKPESIRRLIEASSLAERLRHRGTAIHADFVARMHRFYQSDPEVYEIPGASETFARLRQAGIKVTLDTGFSRDIVRALLDRLGWEARGVIDASIASDEVPRGRPHPDMIRRLMAQFRIDDPARVAKVGDTPADLYEGQNAGCGWIIGVTEGTHTRAQLEPHPHTHLIGTIVELPALFGL
jgi:FAD dependent oxidoreductase TIGR03364/phosphonatase-like hydrolase